MRRFLLIFVLAPLLIGFPTHSASAINTSYQSPTSIDEILYWTGSNGTTTSDCAFDPGRQSVCVDEVYLDGRKLEYKTTEEVRSLLGYVQVYGYPGSFQCWAPTWRKSNPYVSDDVVRVREQCSYTQFHVHFSNQDQLITATVQPKLTVKVRKIRGDFPGTHLGYLHTVGPVHEYIPTSDTNEHATFTISPGLTYGGWFNLTLQNYEAPEYAQSPPRWSYDFFLATTKVNGVFDMSTGFEMLPEAHGSWEASNAAQWGFYGDYKTPEYAIRVAGPHYHYKADPSEPDVLNTSWFSSYMPRALVQRQFGITPEQANETNIEVTRSVGRNPTQLPSTFTATEAGLLIQTDGITFSKPVISIRRKIVVKRNKSLSPASIINAAGIPKSERRTARIQTNPCRNSRKGCTTANSKFIFRKKGTYTFSVSYRTRDARKKPLVKRSRITVRVN